MFCPNCGTKIGNNSKFCFNCGFKIDVGNIGSNSRDTSEISYEDQLDDYDYDDEEEASHTYLSEQMTTAEKRETIILQYIQEIFSLTFSEDDCQFGEKVYIVGNSYIPKEIKNKLDRIWADEKFEVPLLAFNYGNEMMEGFVVTNKRIAWKYSGSSKISYYLEDIADIIVGRAVLARVMKIQTYSGQISSEIYLTGMENIDLFIYKLKDFITVINQSLSNESRDFSDELEADDLEEDDTGLWIDEDDIVSACHTIRSSSIYITLGNPDIAWNHKKSVQARNNFYIPADEKIYLIYDATVMASCKTGLAICSTGIYFNAGKGSMGYINWRDYPKYPVSYSSKNSLSIGLYSFIVSGSDGRQMLQVLLALQDMA